MKETPENPYGEEIETPEGTLLFERLRAVGIGIGITLVVCWALVILAGCGPTHAIFLTSGSKGIIEEPVTVKASVPDATGKLQPHVTVTLQPGTEFKGK